MALVAVAADNARMEPDIAQRIGERVAAGDKIGAIKLLREATGLGLAEAKDVVEAVAAGKAMPILSATAAPAPPPPTGSAQEVSEQIRTLAASSRIAAIRELREQRGLGLKEAKDLLDQAVPVAPSATKRGCLLPLLCGVLVVLGWR